MRGRGLGASNHFEAGGFIRSRAGIRYPDIQFHFLPMAVAYDGSTLAREHGFQAHVGPMRSKSRGWVRLKSPDPAEPPLIQFNYMSHPDDWIEMRACVRLTREIFAQAAFDPYRGREIQPGADCVSDEAIDAFVRERVESAYHPSCSCKMGSPADPSAVVDPETRVIGVEALRVVDSSIMPSITNGNLNAPTIMLAEKAADMILGRDPLPASNAPYSCRAGLGDEAAVTRPDGVAPLCVPTRKAYIRIRQDRKGPSVRTWQVQDAKTRLSEVIERARSEGPQSITRHGKERAVVLSIEEYRLLVAQRPDFKT